MKRTVFIIASVIAVIVAGWLVASQVNRTTGASLEAQFLSAVRDDFPDVKSVKIYDTCDVDAELLENRVGCGTLIVERCVGVVQNEEKDGRIINIDSDFNYISYTGLPFETAVGDEIVTFLVYNPDNNHIDDILVRYDYPAGS
jgi:hypothetical protein